MKVMFEEKPPKGTQKLELTSKDPNSMNSTRKTPAPTNETLEKIEINKGRLLEEIKRTQHLIRANNSKLFKA